MLSRIVLPRRFNNDRGADISFNSSSFSHSSSSSLMTMGIKCSVSVPSGGPPGGPLPRGLERLPAGEIHKG